MREIYPAFYKDFKCIANRCEDSCCKDWDIDVDSETESFYNSVSGALGDKLRRLTVTDSYGERVFISNNGRCPFWNENELCDIYIGLGEEHLSRTCANFPRVHIDYGDFREHLLSFACPEAARFMLKSTREDYSDFGGSSELELAQDSGDFFGFLLKARERTLSILLDRDEPLPYRLCDSLEFNAQVQSLLNGGEPEPLKLEGADSPGCRFIFDMHLGFEIMNGEWRQKLSNASALCEKLDITEDFDRDFEKFMLYYIYRYYLGSVDSPDVLYSIKRIVCAYIVTGTMDAAQRLEENPRSRMRILQRYSKEVEHSYENTEKLNSTFDSDKAFSVESLIAMLCSRIEK